MSEKGTLKQSQSLEVVANPMGIVISGIGTKSLKYKQIGLVPGIGDEGELQKITETDNVLWLRDYDAENLSIFQIVFNKSYKQKDGTGKWGNAKPIEIVYYRLFGRGLVELTGPAGDYSYLGTCQ